MLLIARGEARHAVELVVFNPSQQPLSLAVNVDRLGDRSQADQSLSTGKAQQPARLWKQRVTADQQPKPPYRRLDGLPTLARLDQGMLVTRQGHGRLLSKQLAVRAEDQRHMA